MLQSRIKILSIVFLLGVIGLSARLFYWQVLKGRELSESAQNQYRHSTVVSAPRGNILSTDESFLVLRQDVWQVVANPKEIKDSPKKIADRLGPLMVEDIEDKAVLLETIDKIKVGLEKKDLYWIPIGKEIDLETKKNIEALKIPGISFESRESRLYPEASIAAQLVGFVGKNDQGENVGYFGLEGYYNLALSGKEGFRASEVNAIGDRIVAGKNRQVQALSGVDLVTSIDKRIQLLVHNKLKEGVERYGAKAGTVIVMNPKTGDILAMESTPSYDPKEYWKYGDALFKNPAVSDTFEPGSIFKVLIMASALDADVVDPDTTCDICSGPYKIDKYTIETWNREYRENSTMLDVIVNSDNVGMVFAGFRLGEDKMYDYLDKFGIGKPTRIDLQGEASLSLRKKGTWSDVDLATTTFGQGIAVTPIQMVRAVSAIANDGMMVSPKVVKKIKGEGWEDPSNDSSQEKVISAKAADEITAMMVEAASHGESKWTSLRGFKVAGKTGTAQIPIAGHYDAEKTNASFIGFAPYDDPKFVMLVILSEPKTSQWASETAAPLWYGIAKELFPYLGIQPEN